MKSHTIKRWSQGLALCLLLCTGCNAYLDVQPEDQVTEKQTFENQASTEAVLNGIYINLAHNDLYGANLTSTALEVMGQRYSINTNHRHFNLSRYAYLDDAPKNLTDLIWSKLYSNILNVNNFIVNLEKYKASLPSNNKDLYRGEALALRAFIHFDLLRLYGPIYAKDSVNLAIPYYLLSGKEVNPIEPANQVIDLILKDLKEAEGLLANDPIRIAGPAKQNLTEAPNFLKNRNYRLNYYAVKALQARVNLYRGDKPTALAAANEVLLKTAFFPWTTVKNAKNEKANPDRVFTTEMLFGLQNSQLYTVYDENFNPSVQDNDILASNPTRLNSLYEQQEGDYRWNLNWALPSDGSKTFKTFYKYADIINKDSVFRYSVPLIKISEVYYIAAEAESSNARALSLLNTVRNNRGLLNLPQTANLNTELQKEYSKEFYGEGQLFYFYKRKNLSTVPNASLAFGNINMSKATYVVPLPLSETQPRQ